VNELAQALIGKNSTDDIRIADNYLYDKAAGDSEIEHQMLPRDPGEAVIVYSKLPRRSIRIPTYTGGTNSPDSIFEC